MTPAIPKPAKTNTDKMSSKSPKSPKNREPRPPKKKEDLEKDTVWFLITCIMESASGKIEKVQYIPPHETEHTLYPTSQHDRTDAWWISLTFTLL